MWSAFRSWLLLGVVGTGVPLAALGTGYAISTPRQVARLMAGLLLLEPHHSVYDPCCGSGRLLLAADDVRGRGTLDRAAGLGTVYGQEIQRVPAWRARQALRRRGTPWAISGGSSLTDPAFLDDDGRLLRVDRALANPNWARPVRAQVYAEDAHERFPLGRPPLQTGDWAWAQHLLAHLTPEGAAVMLVDAEVTDRDGDPGGISSERAIRQRLISAGQLRTVVSNPWPVSRPPGLVTQLGRAWLPRAVVLVFGKRPHHDGVQMINLASLHRRYQARELTAEQVINETVRLHRERLPLPSVATLVDAATLAANDLDLTPARYV